MLDFNVFTHQKWDELKRSHSKDVVVHYPDRHQTKGLEKHIEDLKALFVYAPDTRILEHPVKFGSGEWTSVIGVMEGTVAKAYPAAILSQHGLVEDQSPSGPIAVTW